MLAILQPGIALQQGSVQSLANLKEEIVGPEHLPNDLIVSGADEKSLLTYYKAVTLLLNRTHMSMHSFSMLYYNHGNFYVLNIVALYFTMRERQCRHQMRPKAVSVSVAVEPDLGVCSSREEPWLNWVECYIHCAQTINYSRTPLKHFDRHYQRVLEQITE